MGLVHGQAHGLGCLAQELRQGLVVRCCTFMIADCWTCGLCPCHETCLLVCYRLFLRVPLADSALQLCYLKVIGR